MVVFLTMMIIFDIAIFAEVVLTLTDYLRHKADYAGSSSYMQDTCDHLVNSSMFFLIMSSLTLVTVLDYKDMI